VKVRWLVLLGLASIVVPALVVIGIQYLPQEEPAGPEKPAEPSRGERRVAKAAGEFDPVQVVRRYPPLSRPPVVTAEAAAGRLGDGEPVLGVVVDGEARAYPIKMIRFINKEVINDTVGGQPILVSWCEECKAGRVFSRLVDGGERQFYVSGWQWNGNMLMGDVQEQGLWSQVLGRAMDGPSKGKVLDPIPTTTTDWKTWKSRYPDTSVLRFESTSPESMGEVNRPGDRLILGFASGGESRAWPFDRLKSRPVLNDEFLGRPVLVTFDPESGTASLFSRRVDDRDLTFRLEDETLRDDQTGSTWDPTTGRALDGSLRDRRLEHLPGVVVLSRVWDAFYPRGQTWEPGEAPGPGSGGL
jgi:hypothetical protein